MLEKIKSMLGIKTIDYRELLDNGAIIVDVRTPQEFKSGHSKGSKNIPLQNLQGEIKTLKNKEVVLVCQSGMRATQAKSMLGQNGITAHNAGSWTRFSNL